MLVYAGIDEAGYGPLLGPLVVARSVFLVADAGPLDDPPCLWTRLAPVIGRAADRDALVAVDDSKRLHSPAAGLRRLECGVLALLEADPPPASLAGLLTHVAVDDDSRASALPWYGDAGGGPALPTATPADSLASARGSAAAALGAAGVTAADAAAAVVFEDRFNRTVIETGNKAACAWRFVAGHLAALWRRHANVLVILDRQGGRQFYAGPLERLFPEARCCVVAEGPEVSRYELRDRDRYLRLEVRARAEAAHLPVAYASMLAKYLRELLMLRFQRYWTEKAPDVRPTAGYYHDGQRFLREMGPRLRELEIPAGSLVRLC